MKKPRVEDFDPKAASKLRSSFDDMPAILPPSKPTPIPDQTATEGQVAVFSQQPGKPASQETVNPGLREPEKPATRETSNPGIREAGFTGTREPGELGPDFRQVPTRKETFMFVEQESADMEDVKIELKRKFDIKTTKQDIARVAVCELVADYKQKGEHSRLIQVLRKKASR